MLKRNGISVAGFLTFWAICCFLPSARAQQAASTEANPLNRIAWLVGDWLASSEADGQPAQVRLFVKWSADRRSINVSCTEIAVNEQTAKPQYDATYVWDPKKKKIVVTETRANGDRFEGTVLAGGYDFVQSGKVIRENDTPTEVSVTYNQ